MKIIKLLKTNRKYRIWTLIIYKMINLLVKIIIIISLTKHKQMFLKIVNGYNKIKLMNRRDLCIKPNLFVFLIQI